MSAADTCPDATTDAIDVFDAISLNQTTASAVCTVPFQAIRQPVPITYSSVFTIPAAWSGPPNVTISGEITHVASVYLARWSAPITCDGVAIRPGTGHEFGWDDKRWVSLGSFRRGGRRPGQWGERARKRRAKRRERARFTRAYKRFDRYLDTRQGQNWSDVENARNPSEGP